MMCMVAVVVLVLLGNNSVTQDEDRRFLAAITIMMGWVTRV
jgi:hypothetical protein